MNGLCGSLSFKKVNLVLNTIRGDGGENQVIYYNIVVLLVSLCPLAIELQERTK